MRGYRSLLVGQVWALALSGAVLAFGCGGRAASCDADDVECADVTLRADMQDDVQAEGPSPPAMPSGASGSVNAPATAGIGRVDTSPVGPVTNPPASCDEPPTNEPSNECSFATPLFPNRFDACVEQWCDARPWPAVVSCAPVPMTFAGGHHYRVEGAGYVADFVFSPYPIDPTLPVPQMEDLGGVRLMFDLGQTVERNIPVRMNVELSFDEALQAGLDVVDGLIVGQLDLAALADDAERPLYQDGCRPGADIFGNVMPGDCACGFGVPGGIVPVHVRLGPLFTN